VGVAGCDLTLQAGGQGTPRGLHPTVLARSATPARRRVSSLAAGRAAPRCSWAARLWESNLPIRATAGSSRSCHRRPPAAIFRCSLPRCYLCVPPSADRDRPLLVVAMTLCLLLGPLFATGVDVTYASAVATELPGGGFALSGLPDTCRAIGVDPARLGSASADRAACGRRGRLSPRHVRPGFFRRIGPQVNDQAKDANSESSQWIFQRYNSSCPEKT
jgi:hypothetical protein